MMLIIIKIFFLGKRFSDTKCPKLFIREVTNVTTFYHIRL